MNNSDLEIRSGLFFAPSASRGGAERVLYDIAKPWAEGLLGRSPSVVCLENGPLLHDLEKLGLKCRELSLSQRLMKLGDSPARNQAKFKQLLGLGLSLPDFFMALKATKRSLGFPLPGWIHSNGFKTHILAALSAPKNLPIFWHIHDFVGQRPIMRKLLKTTWRKGIIAIAVSQAVAIDLMENIPKCPVVVWRNTIDTDKFHEKVNDSIDLDSLAGFDSGWSGIRIGMVATYARWKGHETFLRAAALLQNLGVPVRFYIVGGPVYRSLVSQWSSEELRHSVRDSGLEGKVGLVPFQSNTPPVYSALDIVVHASNKSEPFGLSIAEAMACAKPTVAVLQGGAAEIGSDGIDCLGFRPGDHEGLAACLSRLIGDQSLRDRLGRSGARKIREKFSKDVIIPRWMELVRSAIPNANNSS